MTTLVNLNSEPIDMMQLSRLSELIGWTMASQIAQMSISRDDLERMISDYRTGKVKVTIYLAHHK
jgi:hypothetical protein